jgi:hypothetical protein
MFAMLQHAQHAIITGFRLSEKQRRGMKQPAIATTDGGGSRQWCWPSNMGGKVMKEQGFGATLQSTITNRICSLVGYTFVDDMDLVHTAQVMDILTSELLSQYQQVVDHWQGLLEATGGAIEPTKSFHIHPGF